MGICFGTMMVADLITMKVAEPGNTTMRDMPFSENISEEDRRKITLFHSSQQGGATVAMLLNINSAFGPLFAIQFSMFLMTMVRKSIITTNTWQLIYSLSLIINGFILYTLSFSKIIILASVLIIFPILRIQMHINKYVVWSIIFGFIHLFNSYDLQYIDNFKHTNIIIYSGICYYIISSMYTIRSLYMPLLLRKEI
jgi:hypothetical protein